LWQIIRHYPEGGAQNFAPYLDGNDVTLRALLIFQPAR
jgi:hypothetical protein